MNSSQPRWNIRNKSVEDEVPDPCFCSGHRELSSQNSTEKNKDNMLAICQICQLTLHPERIILLFLLGAEHWRNSSSWRVQAAHFCVGFFAIKMNMDQENPALAPEKRKVLGKNEPGFCLGLGSGSGVPSNESTVWGGGLISSETSFSMISLLRFHARKKIQYSRNRRTDRWVAQIKRPEEINLGCRSKRPVGWFQYLGNRRADRKEIKREKLLVARSWRHEDEAGRSDPGLHAQISGTYAQIRASTIHVVLMLLLAIGETCCGASKAPRHSVAVMAGVGGRFEEVLQEGRLMRRRGWSRRKN
jgi:hypothetical protein